jgi:type IV pilus assembly protein PilE
MMNLRPISRRSGGFTLIELMCAVSIAGFLSSVAYPTFKSVIHKARRSDALVAVMQVQVAQERHRSTHAAYGSLDEIGIAALSPARHYTLVISASSDSGYDVEATATGSQTADTSCRVLKLKVEGTNLSQSSGLNASTDNPSEVNRKCWSL